MIRNQNALTAKVPLFGMEFDAKGQKELIFPLIFEHSIKEQICHWEIKLEN